MCEGSLPTIEVRLAFIVPSPGDLKISGSGNDKSATGTHALLGFCKNEFFVPWASDSRIAAMIGNRLDAEALSS